MRFPWLEEAAIEAAAHKLRVAALGGTWTRSAPVDLETIIYDHLCEREGLAFTDERDLGCEGGQEILGRTRPLASKIEITRALTEPGQRGRYRFTVAHELGHWVLHRPLFLAQREHLSLFGDTEAAATLTSLNRGIFPEGAPRSVPPEEWQANRFAIALLVEPDTLREEFELRFGPAPVARRSPGWRHSRTLREHARLLASGDAMSRPPLCPVFGLSVEAMAIVLETRHYAVEAPALI